MPWEEEVDNNVCGELGAGQAYSKQMLSKYQLLLVFQKYSPEGRPGPLSLRSGPRASQPH